MALLTSSEGGVELTRSLPIGCEITCTTVTGDTLRGNLVAVDKPNKLVVLSIHHGISTHLGKAFAVCLSDLLTQIQASCANNYVHTWGL